MAKTAEEAIYEASELIAGYSAFDVPQEVVIATIKTNSITQATETQMKKLIKEFTVREVI